MTDEPGIPNVPEPADDSTPEMETGQPTKTPPDSAPQPEAEDYVSEIRQRLASEESAGARKSGGLIRRLTGSARRPAPPRRGQTGPLREPSARPAGEGPAPSEIGDDFLADRLGGTVSETPAEPLPAEQPEEWSDLGPESGWQEPAAPPLFDAETVHRLETGPLPELGIPAEEEQEPEPEWMKEIRKGSSAPVFPARPASPVKPPDAASAEPGPEAGQETPPEQEPAARPTSSLRSFLTGLLRGQEERQRRGEGQEIPDELVSDRLERSLGLGAEEAAALEAAAEQAPADEAPSIEDLLAQAAAAGETAAPPAEGQEFGELPPFPFAEEQAGEAGAPPLFGEDVIFPEGLPGFKEETAPGAAAITPEDEALLWGEEAAPAGEKPVEGQTFTPEDLWAQGEAPPAPGEQRRGQGVHQDDLYAAAYLTGEDYVPEEEIPLSQDQLLREALEKGIAPEEDVSLEEIRSIALEDYQEEAALQAAGPKPLPATPAEVEYEEDLYLPEAVEAEREPFSLKRIIAAPTPAEKVLRLEMVLVVLALLVAIPFFIYMIARGPVYKVGYISPRPLPEYLPYPTGILLPGGWSFPLQKSTFVEGQWKPTTSEWLEGTELRRVVALPWNPQTEAVINSFKPGDKVQLDLSNNDTVEYTVTRVERVTQSDTNILSDRSPSLVIILYKEKSAERWVVFCKP